MNKPDDKFWREKNSKIHTSKILRRSPKETQAQFIERMNKSGYNNGKLETLPAHWNSDTSEYHVGTQESCSRCGSDGEQNTSRRKRDIRYEVPSKIGGFRKLKNGDVSCILHMSASMASMIEKASRGSVKVSVNLAAADSSTEHTVSDSVLDTDSDANESKVQLKEADISLDDTAELSGTSDRNEPVQQESEDTQSSESRSDSSDGADQSSDKQRRTDGRSDNETGTNQERRKR